MSLQLASQSPRRRELLQQIGVPFVIVEGEVDERPSADESADCYVLRLAVEKARAGFRRRPEGPTLGSDTVVVCAGELMGKPKDDKHAAEMLRRLAGRTHQVLTAVAIYDGEKLETALSCSEVTFREMSELEITRYCCTGEPLGKAGGYAIQGFAAVFVRQLTGSYSGVMGLPLQETSELLERFAIPVWAVQD